MHQQFVKKVPGFWRFFGFPGFPGTSQPGNLETSRSSRKKSIYVTVIYKIRSLCYIDKLVRILGELGIVAPQTTVVVRKLSRWFGRLVVFTIRPLWHTNTNPFHTLPVHSTWYLTFHGKHTRAETQHSEDNVQWCRLWSRERSGVCHTCWEGRYVLLHEPRVPMDTNNYVDQPRRPHSRPKKQHSTVKPLRKPRSQKLYHVSVVKRMMHQPARTIILNVTFLFLCYTSFFIRPKAIFYENNRIYHLISLTAVSVSFYRFLKFP